MAREKKNKKNKKTELQQTNATPAYGVNPPPGDNVRYSKVPTNLSTLTEETMPIPISRKEKRKARRKKRSIEREDVDVGTLLDSMDWASEYENLTEFTDERDPRKGEVKTGFDNPRTAGRRSRVRRGENIVGDKVKPLGYINPYFRSDNPEVELKRRVGETFHNLQNVAPNTYDKLFTAATADLHGDNYARRHYLEDTYERMQERGETRSFDDWFKDSWFPQEIGGYLINATTPELNPTGEWSQNSWSQQWSNEFRDALDEFGERLGIDKYLGYGSGEGVSLSARALSKGIKAYKKREDVGDYEQIAGSWSKTALPFEVYMDSTVGGNTGTITRDTVKNFPSYTMAHNEATKAAIVRIVKRGIKDKLYFINEEGQVRSHTSGHGGHLTRNLKLHNPDSSDGAWALGMNSGSAIKGGGGLYEVFGDLAILGTSKGDFTLYDEYNFDPTFHGNVTKPGILGGGKLGDLNWEHINAVKNLATDPEGNIDINSGRMRNLAEKFGGTYLPDVDLYENKKTGVVVKKGDWKGRYYQYSDLTKDDYKLYKKAKSRPVRIKYTMKELFGAKEWAEIEKQLIANRDWTGKTGDLASVYGPTAPPSLGTLTITAKKINDSVPLQSQKP